MTRTVTLYPDVADLVTEHLTNDQVGGDEGMIFNAATDDSGASTFGGIWLSRSLCVSLMEDAYRLGQSHPHDTPSEYKEDCEEYEDEDE